ncbi:hypothetical protein IQ255_14690 [Pleurocapsales cyanobacterium LEGE 10410]|nr:hypothetical protein [Pleurocapsales cyanobacterium LEGE 10410]
MSAYLGFIAIPLIGIVSPIYLSFNRDIKPINKALLFFTLPILEILLSTLAIVKSISKNANFHNIWQPQLIALLVILGLSLSLIVALVEELDRTVKQAIRLTGLAIFSIVGVWISVSLYHN